MPLVNSSYANKKTKTQQKHGKHHRTGIYMAKVELIIDTGPFLSWEYDSPRWIPTPVGVLRSPKRPNPRCCISWWALRCWAPWRVQLMLIVAYFSPEKMGQPSWGCIFSRKDNLKMCSIWSELADWVWIGGGNSLFANSTSLLKGLKWWSAESFLVWHFRET